MSTCVATLKRVAMPTRHAFSMDVEGLAESMVESFPVPREMLKPGASSAEIERNMAETLDALAEHCIAGTFFILGRIAEHHSALIRRIAEAGHEVASHSHHHRRLHRLSRETAREELVRSRKTLEDVCGRAVVGFRAPDFSINRASLWLTDTLLEVGYKYDSSFYPVRGHDVYGMPDTPARPYRLANGLVEFPLSTWGPGRIKIPVLGGGYFRLYPLAITRLILRRFDRFGWPAMFYIHPYEFASCCPRIGRIGAYRQFRHYFQCHRTKNRFIQLFREFTFDRVDNILTSLKLL